MALTQVAGGLIAPSTTLTTPIIATTLGVGNATPAATGAGVTFPATQSASSDANTLDDYEEGTFTSTFSYSSTLTSTTPTATGTVSGTYVKVGRIVRVDLSAISQTVMGNIVLFSVTLPFSASTGQGYFSGYNVTGRYGGTSISPWYPQVGAGGSATATLYAQTPNSNGSGFPSLESSGANIGISITYIASA